MNKNERITQARKLNMVVWIGMLFFMFVSILIPLIFDNVFHGIIDVSFDINKIAEGLIFYIVFGLIIHFGFHVILGNLSLKNLKAKDHLKEAIKVSRKQIIYSMLFLYALAFPVIGAYMAGLSKLETFVIVLFPFSIGLLSYPKKHYIEKHINSISNFQKYYLPKSKPEFENASKKEQTRVNNKLKKNQVLWSIYSLLIISILLFVTINANSLYGKIEVVGNYEKFWLYYLIFSVCISCLTLLIRSIMLNSVGDNCKSTTMPLEETANVYFKSMIYAFLIIILVAMYTIFFVLMSKTNVIQYVYIVDVLVIIIIFWFFPRINQIKKTTFIISQKLRNTHM